MSGSSVFYDTTGASVAPGGSSVFFDTTGAAILPGGSSVMYDTGGTTMTNLLVRGPQFNPRTIPTDRFSQFLLSSLSVSNSFSLLSTGATSVYTVPSGKMALVIGVLIRVLNAVNVTTEAQVSVGINPSTDNLFNTETLDEITSTGDIWAFWADKTAHAVANAGDVIDVVVDVAATGDALDVEAYIMGLHI